MPGRAQSVNLISERITAQPVFTMKKLPLIRVEMFKGMWQWQVSQFRGYKFGLAPKPSPSVIGPAKGRPLGRVPE